MAFDSENLPLGKVVPFPEQYDASLLRAIPRADVRAKHGLDIAGDSFEGADYWTAYEFSWLNARGKPEFAILRFTVPASSPSILESKSVKLYLGSFLQSVFLDWASVKTQLERDFASVLGRRVPLLMYGVNSPEITEIEMPKGICIDNLPLDVNHYDYSPELLRTVEGASQIVEEQYFSDALVTRCPVSGQPDWASVELRYKGVKIVPYSLLAYLVSLRTVSIFQEVCADRMFADISERCKPQELRLTLHFSRRGGIQIAPVRGSLQQRQWPVRVPRQ